MRRLFAVLLALGLAGETGAVLADDAGQTVSDYENAMNASADQLDAQVTERQKAGDMAAAQRLVLASAMVRRTAEEFRGAEQASMTYAVSGLPAPVPARAAAAAAEATKAVADAARDPGFIADAHKTFNALLAVLPIKEPHPVFYGALTSDLSPTPLSSDVVIYGYRLIDPIYDTKPTVQFKKQEIDSVAVSEDRIDVTLPPEVKQDINFQPPPCEPRGSFGLRVSAIYSDRHGVWPIIWHSQVLTNADIYLLPSPLIYAASVTTSTQAAAATLTETPFQVRSSLATANCEETGFAEVDVPLPEGAKNFRCTATWEDASGAAKMDARCASDATTLRAVGEIVGGAKVCSPNKLCTCATSAQGFLQATGSYQVEAVDPQINVKTEPTPVTFPAGGVAVSDVAIAAGQKLRHVAVSVSRQKCPAELDSLDLNIGDDPQGKASASSKSGAFRAAIEGGRLSVGAADAFAADISKAP